MENTATGASKEVITLPELIRIMAENRKNGVGDTLMIGDRRIRNVAMIHCVGSRQILRAFTNRMPKEISMNTAPGPVAAQPCMRRA